MRALIVEDDPDIRRDLVDALGHAGFKVDAAGDVVESFGGPAGSFPVVEVAFVAGVDLEEAAAGALQRKLAGHREA